MNEESEKAKIRAVIEAWIDASKARDLGRLLPLMAEDVVFLLAGTEPMVGRDAFAAASRAAKPAFTFVSGRPQIREIHVAGPLAVVWNFLEVTMADNAGQQHHRAGHILSVFRKEPDGRWVLFRDANLLAPKKGA